MAFSDLSVMGAGRLGRAVLRRWRTAHPNGRLVAETRRGIAAEPEVEWRARTAPGVVRGPNVLFCVPPRDIDDYTAEARRAIEAWDGNGAALFVSSTAVYAENSGGWVTETSPLADHPRAARLLAAEQEFLARGGMVLRLAGLYSAERGPHLTYRKATPTAESGASWINLIEEEDAARLCVAALQSGSRGAVYLGCDGNPITREELWRLISGGEPSPFRGSGVTGRRTRNNWTRQDLAWEPRYGRFADWWQQRK